MRLMLFALLSLAAMAAHAVFPERPIRLVVPYAPGGTADILARLLANAAGDFLPQRVIVENKAGANGNVGMDFVAKSPADGYTVGVCAIGNCSVNRALYKMPYDIQRDLRPVFWASSVANMVTVKSALPVHSIKEFVQLARTRELSYGSSGVGSAHQLGAELLADQFGLKFLHVPFKGAAPALQEVIAGRIDFMVENVSTLVGPLRSGTIRGLAVTGRERSPAAPDIATLRELGYPNLLIIAWHGFATAAGTPAEHVATLNAAFNRALAAAAVQARYRDLDLIPEGGPPERFGAHIDAEITKWAEIVRKRGIKGE